MEDRREADSAIMSYKSTFQNKQRETIKSLSSALLAYKISTYKLDDMGKPLAID